MTKDKIFFTIFTPVYNGENLFHRAYDSINGSIYKDFEWIIINDGSTDHSDDTIRALIKDSNHDIKYINWNINKGKHIAWNYASQVAQGDVFIVLDCDDSFIPEALVILNEKWKQHFDDKEVYGIDTLCINPKNNTIYGTGYPFDGIKATFEELFCHHNVRGEKWNSFRTEYMREIKFPELRSPYYSENFMLNSLSLKYKVIGYNIVLRKYYHVPTSLVNNPSVKFDVVKMNIHYNSWYLRTWGWDVLRMSPKVLIETILRQLRRHLICLFMKSLKIKEIIRN